MVPTPKISKKLHIDLSGIERLFVKLIPEHFGDLFVLTLIAVFALGAVFFFLFAWLPVSENPAPQKLERIPFFSDDELMQIVKILKAREEASTAPVTPPARDPFK